MTEWQEDMLGPDYQCVVVDLEPDDEGPVVTTIVRHAPISTRDRSTRPAFAFLAIHGWNDYFYQTQLAESITGAGGAFFALDLRKYGRSHREWQTFGFSDNLDMYDDDIHAATDVIVQEFGTDIPLVLYGHSTGGLIATLWADRHPGALAGLILNSPWLELQANTAFRQLSAPILDRISRLAPKSVIPISDNGFYQKVLTAGFSEGERAVPGAPDGTTDPFWTTGWQPDPRFRTMPSPSMRVAWLSAILAGQARVAAGLDITCPILVLTSNRSVARPTWSEDYRAGDGVLDVQQIWKRIPGLGSCVTLCKLTDAIHDVTLSRESVRREAFRIINRFVYASVLQLA
ncbi:alpha/beta fold hydrolase [Changpingibacter yushuensis]|uniref:alpha/beta fold hydrolase n=1 Tax=Changpingibacter yushuensis TaxID=2758440 RepID=UPI0015F69771|nr:alpha/beta hydrolase [Changpingibacter yushuensis]